MSTETMALTESIPVSADVLGGAVLTALGLLHIFALGVGGVGGFIVLLAGWPLIVGSIAARLSTTSSDRRISGTLSGTFGALIVTLAILATGFIGAWPSFITTNIGVSLWPVTLAMLVVLTISWTTFGYAGGYLVDSLVS